MKGPNKTVTTPIEVGTMRSSPLLSTISTEDVTGSVSHHDDSIVVFGKLVVHGEGRAAMDAW